MTDELLRILVIEDDVNHAELLAELLERAGYQVSTASSFEQGMLRLESQEFELALTDLQLGAHRGTEVLKAALKLQPGIEVMVVSGAGSIEDAVEAMHLGASHYFTKPLKVDEIRAVVGKAADRIRDRRRSAGVERFIERERGFEGIIGQSPGMLRIYDTVKRIAATSATVLIQGENGTGKELVAKAIHNLSDRREAHFVALNCAALSEGVLESELFGHEKGAFTGAAAAREGKFEYAHGGTLFLDEVGDMPLSLQVKLLRVVQEREIVRVGSNRNIKVDVRLIAATHRDLEKLIQEGRFREDLYYRLRVVRLEMPSLRDRVEDIPSLVNHFTKEFSQRHGRPMVGIDPEALEILQAHSWPGNVRELQNTVETMVLLSRGDHLDVESIPPEVTRRPLVEASGSTALVARRDLASFTLQEWEKELIKLHLARQEGNRARVAKALGISERTLYRKLKEYDLS